MTSLPVDPIEGLTEDEIEELIDRYYRLTTNPGHFFLKEWPGIEWQRVWNRFSPAYLWTDALQAWAMYHGHQMRLTHKGEAFEAADAEWGHFRPEFNDVIEVGRHSILKELGTPDNPDVIEVADAFAEAWAVTEGNELAAIALEAKFSRTRVTGLVLVDGPGWWPGDGYALNGKVAYHIVGDPRNADLQTFMKHVDEWAALMTGFRLPNKGGRPKGTGKNLTPEMIAEVYEEIYDGGTVPFPQKWEVADRLKVHRNTLANYLRKPGFKWPPKDL